MHPELELLTCHFFGHWSLICVTSLDCDDAEVLKIEYLSIYVESGIVTIRIAHVLFSSLEFVSLTITILPRGDDFHCGSKIRSCLG